MEYAIALRFEDGATRFIRCADDETIADAAFRRKINVPMDCRDGVCGTCKAFLAAGEVDPGEYLEDALSEAEAAQGFVLACQCCPRSDCVVEILASSAVCKVAPARHAGEIQCVERLSDTTFGLSVLPYDPAALTFLPGQYVNLEIPGTALARSYSFSSGPDAGSAAFLIRDIPGGEMTSFLHDRATPGMQIHFTGPFGAFYLRDVKRPILMLAGGTGLAPFLSMLHVLATGKSAQRIQLVYGVTRDVDLVAVDRLETFKLALPGFSYDICVVDPASIHPKHGYVTDHIDTTFAGGRTTDVYLCGPPPMVEAVSTWLAASTIPHAHFFYEKFLPSEAAA